ncbi:BTAD domain-containing putative transcriptional regulator [Actinoplanes sp. GCM10030250]|uniref:AfsR/SARP family transcriptional regulator n=1 Tax=Actinoplanes sp. GCM10030250 TaxID=3273376 RepID=UPI00360BDBDF
MAVRDVWFTVLGPVRAWTGDREVDLGAPQARALLALLLAHGGQAVSLARLVDAMWGEDPPRTAVNAIHRNVGLLRRMIEPELPARHPGGWLVRAAGGYRLDVDGESLDLLRFRRLVRQARQPGSPDPVGLYRRALRLWDGAGGDGIDAQVRGDAVFTRLDQELSTVAREAADTALAFGAAGELADVVELVAGRAPFDEPLHARLIRLLSAAGQRARALGAYQALRVRLDEELGISPGPEVVAAHRTALQLEPVRSLPGRARGLRSVRLLSYGSNGCRFSVL